MDVVEKRCQHDAGGEEGVHLFEIKRSRVGGGEVLLVEADAGGVEIEGTVGVVGCG